MNGLYTITLPKGKISVGTEFTDRIDYCGSPYGDLIAQDLNQGGRGEPIVRKELIWLRSQKKGGDNTEKHIPIVLPEWACILVALCAAQFLASGDVKRVENGAFTPDRSVHYGKGRNLENKDSAGFPRGLQPRYSLATRLIRRCNDRNN